MRNKSHIMLLLYKYKWRIRKNVRVTGFLPGVHKVSNSLVAV